MRDYGRLGRLGRWSAEHARLVIIGWVAVFLALGLLAPRAEDSLSGAGWKALGSESVEARTVIDREFGGLGAYSLAALVETDRPGNALDRAIGRVSRILDQDPATGRVLSQPSERTRIADRRIAVVRAGAAAGDTEMVRAAERLAEELDDADDETAEVLLTGAPSIWAEFNEANKSAMLKSEVMSWPVTLAILLIAFGSLVAAGLPLMLAILGLTSAAGGLWIAAQFADVTIWAMNFALMFALAVGIDYALFIVVRYRAALRSGRRPLDAIGIAQDTAGKAVLVSGLTVIASLAAVMLVPSPPFRTGALGIVLAVSFVLAASLTLLPAVLAKLGARINGLALPVAGGLEHRSESFARWGRAIWRRPALLMSAGLVVLAVLLVPLLGLNTEMPSLGALPEDAESRVGSERLEAAFGSGSTSEMQIVVPVEDAENARAALQRRSDVRSVAKPEVAADTALLRAIPDGGPGSARGTLAGVRADLPPGALVGGAAAERIDLGTTLDEWTPRLYAIVLGIGFILLVVILRAPIVAAISILLGLLATGAAFGAAKLIFQDGGGEGLLGFASQGFLSAWAPVFFFALIFALAMDYTVFLLATVRERLDQSGDPAEAVISGLAETGRTINAAAIVMVFVFFTFALSGPLPPKEMGVILGIAVLLDATVVRLLLLPAFLRLLGPYAWWMPARVERWVPRLGLEHSS